METKKSAFILSTIFVAVAILDYAINAFGYSDLPQTITTIFATKAYVFRFMLCVSLSFAMWLGYDTAPPTKYNYDAKTKSALFAFSALLMALFSIQHLLPSAILVFSFPLLAIGFYLSTLHLIFSFKKKVNKEDNPLSLTAEAKPVENELGFVIPCHNGYISIPNPFRSIGVLGGAGAGKSVSIIEWLLLQMIEKNYSGIIYDFKMWSLGNFVVTAIAHVNKERKLKGLEPYPCKVRFINVEDPEQTNRFNAIPPHLITGAPAAMQFARNYYINLAEKSADKLDPFFDSQSIGLLATTFYWLSKRPKYCTLPHAMILLLTCNVFELAAMFSTDRITKTMYNDFIEAYTEGAGKTVANVITSLRNHMKKFLDPNIFYMLTGDDFPIELNTKEDPTLLVIGNSTITADAMSPLWGFIIGNCMGRMNQKNRHHSLVVLDEAPTVRIDKLYQIPNTARSNKLGIVYLAQDKSQMLLQYGEHETEAIIASLGTQLVGNTGSQTTAELYSRVFGKELVMDESISDTSSSSTTTSSKSSGVTYRETERPRLRPQWIMELDKGQFYGKLVDASKVWVQAKFKRVEDVRPEKYWEEKGGGRLNVPSFNKKRLSEGFSPQQVMDSVMDDIEVLRAEFELDTLNMRTMMHQINDRPDDMIPNE